MTQQEKFSLQLEIDETPENKEIVNTFTMKLNKKNKFKKIINSVFGFSIYLITWMVLYSFLIAFLNLFSINIILLFAIKIIVGFYISFKIYLITDFDLLEYTDFNTNEIKENIQLLIDRNIIEPIKNIENFNSMSYITMIRDKKIRIRFDQ